MIVDNDTIIGYGLGYPDNTYSQQGLILSKFDSSGNHLFSRMILDPLGEHLSISYHWGKIAKTRDGGYIMTAAPTHGDAAWLVKVDHGLEVEFIKEYLDTVNRSHFWYNAPIELSDGYLLSGAVQRPNYKDNPFARRVDRQGNTLWFKYYGDYDTDAVTNAAAKVNDSLFVLSGTIVLPSPNTGRVAIRFIDGQGEVVRLWQSAPNPEAGYNRNILPLDDGGMITFGLYLVEVINGAGIVQPTLARLDSNFQLEWVRHFGYKAKLGAYVRLLDIEQISDGNYIGAGENLVKDGDGTIRKVGWLYKFSPQGDSIWETLADAPFPILENNYGRLAGVGELSSGSIVAAGETIEFNRRYIWLVKVAPDGCLDTLCSMVSPVRPEALFREEGFSLYPNPSNGRFRLSWEQAPAGSNALCTLFDAQGRAAWREERPAAPEMDIGASGLAPGFYVLEVRAEGRRWMGKVVVGE